VGSYLKLLALLSVAIILTSGTLMIEAVSAQSTSEPSIPEFTVRLISSAPESQSTNKTIELSIKNQPSVSGIGFFYMVRARINDGNWSLLYTIDNVPGKSSGEYTTLSYPSDQPVVEYQYMLGDKLKNLFPGDRIDFQVQAMIGLIHRVYNPNHTSQLDMYPYVFTGEISQWSQTQTVTIPDNLATSTAASPIDYSRFTLKFVLVTVVIILGAGLVVYYFSKRKSA
jgi:hypothetical protein